MRKTVGYYSVRILMFALICTLSALVYELYFHPNVLKEEGWLKLLAEQRLSEKTDILYFSASPNQASAPNDTNRAFISQFLEGELNRKITVFDTGAIHAEIFLHALKEMKVKPKLIFVDLNLRSFGNQWIHSGLENSLQRNLTYWNSNFGFWNRIQVVLKNYDFIPYQERKNQIYYAEKFHHLSNKHTIKTWIDSLFLADKENSIGREMVRHFAFEIDDKNKMLRHYDSLFLFCEEQNIQVIATILPENTEGMKKYAGNDLSEICHKNSHFLKNHFKKSNVLILDLLSVFDESYFFETFPTEHYNQKGRAFIAKRQAEVFKSTGLYQ